MQSVAFNAAIQFGIERAKRMITHAHDNPYALLREGSHIYWHLAHQNPARYGGSLRGWEKRQREIKRELENAFGNSPEQRTSLSTDEYDPTDQNEGKNVEITLVNNPEDLKPIRIPTIIQMPQLQPEYTKTAVSHPVAYPYRHTNSWLEFITLSFVLSGCLLKNRGQNFTYLQSFPASDEPEDATSKTEPFFNRNRKTWPRNPTYSNLLLSESLLQLGLSHEEREAFKKVLGQYRTTVNDNKLYVNLPENSQVIVRKSNVTMRGNEGIKAALCYAAQAWNNQCALKNVSENNKEKITSIAQELVNDGTLRSGFTIKGLGTFTKEFEGQRPANPFQIPFDNARKLAA
jgi:hypothetical protein